MPRIFALSSKSPRGFTRRLRERWIIKALRRLCAQPSLARYRMRPDRIYIISDQQPRHRWKTIFIKASSRFYYPFARPLVIQSIRSPPPLYYVIKELNPPLRKEDIINFFFYLFIYHRCFCLQLLLLEFRIGRKEEELIMFSFANFSQLVNIS